ncbi:calcium/calmodulin-dependent serine/threonine-protein kinase isoform X2 [Vigna radiata var. radiata]|uniref:non-specific serine/threonine protein kinase n=1 Tax=Vigna radiata var. radiata TaxID=3916 RepID=A0A3Q0EQH5_VIGRR|nr:calcium/calmodulin-dependent serine/threonine-protein kinase isoform X2 [Vigna radiata var. radiata]
MSTGSSGSSATAAMEKARVSRTSLILWHSHQNDAAAVRKLLEEDPSLVKARDYDSRTPLHVASLHGWVEVANCLLEFGADVNALDRWKNTPLADAEGAKKLPIIELLTLNGGLSYGQNGSHSEKSPVLPPLPNKCDWEVDPSELDFSHSVCIGKGSFGEILKAHWRGTPVAVKRILPSLSDDRLVIGMAYLHNEPNVIIHRDLKPRNVLLVNSSADHLKVGDFGLSKLIKVQSSHDVYKMTGETGSYRYMAPEVFKHRRYDKKVDVFSFAMILYEMLEGEPPFSNYEPYDGAKYVAEGHRPSFRSKSYTSDLRDLTEECWSSDISQRPSFIEILKRLEKIKENLPSDHHWRVFAS